MTAHSTPTLYPATHTGGERVPGGPLRVAVITGSTREGRFGPVVAEWFAGEAAHRPDLDIDKVDLADHQHSGSGFAGHIAAADAFVVVCPEYNHAYPGVLKTAIDSVGPQWHAKPVGFVSYGGISGGLRAVEQLRLVFAELHAVTVRETVSFHHASTRFAPDGRPLDAHVVGAAAKALLDQLSWWAHALREARVLHPYGG